MGSGNLAHIGVRTSRPFGPQRAAILPTISGLPRDEITRVRYHAVVVSLVCEFLIAEMSYKTADRPSTPLVDYQLRWYSSTEVLYKHILYFF